MDRWNEPTTRVEAGGAELEAFARETSREGTGRTVQLERPPSTTRLWGRLQRRLRVIASQLRWRWRFGSFGWRSVLIAPDLVTNPHEIFIGSEVEIRKGARLESRKGSRDGTPSLRIGDRTQIHNYFHCGAVERVDIGARVLIAGRVYITDHDHDPGGPGRPPITNRTVHAAPTILEDECWIGEGAMILKGVRVGRGSIVAAGSVVTRDVPEYTIVAGVPARPLKRWDDDANGWVACRPAAG